MNEIAFLVGLTAGIVVGLLALARLWQVDLRSTFKRI